jgi:hypothetical protein
LALSSCGWLPLWLDHKIDPPKKKKNRTKNPLVTQPTNHEKKSTFYLQITLAQKSNYVKKTQKAKKENYLSDRKSLE